jgi:hypothetical protein
VTGPDESGAGRDWAALPTTLRRIVTANDANGRSFGMVDGPPDPVLEFAPGDGLYEAWSDDGSSAIQDYETAALLPLPGGVKLRWFTVHPLPKGVPVEKFRPGFAAAFKRMADVDVQPDVTRHPGMHLTRTLDLITVISGRVTLLLDDSEHTLGPGDVVVQRATNHAWVCEGDTPALLTAVLIDRPD